ncbi:MAG: HAMP domain-containing protein [Betaproteobacteria bacterium]|nr:HAMP domain-containing protein [Betaproteobacteria bacterium]
MFSNLSVRMKLAVVAIVATVGAITLAGFNFYSGRASSQALGQVYEVNVHSLVQLQKIDALLREVRFRVAGVVLDVMPYVGSNIHLQESRKEMASLWSEVTAAASGSPSVEERQLLDEMAKGWSGVQATLDKIEKAYGAHSSEQLTEVLESDWAVVHKSFIKPLSSLLPLKEAGAKATYERSSALNATLTSASVVLAAVLIGLILVVVIWVMRSITKSLDEAVNVARQVAGGDLTTAIVVDRRDELGKLLQALGEMQDALRRVVGDVRSSVQDIATASIEIAQGNADLSSRTEEQASSLEETASSMEELTSTVKQNAGNAQQANELAAGASSVAVRGGKVVSQVVETMDGISQSSRKIADIIGVIDGIAFQTNILALNAAVEAARAGEQGRGFAVVASEVRSLAQRSAEAAKEIKSLIQDSVGKVEFGARLVDEAGKTMDEIVTSVKRVTDIMTDITAASQEQSSGIMQVNRAITQMDQVTQQNAALVQEASAAAESLKGQSSRLSQAVAVFRLGDDRDHLDASGAPARASHAPRAERLVSLPKHERRDVSLGRSVQRVDDGGAQEWQEF